MNVPVSPPPIKPVEAHEYALESIPMRYRDHTTGFAKGWYWVCDSDELVAGELKPLNYLDRQMIAYRDLDGVARITDAYCPHLGAHLASHDGCLTEGQIVCPFHKWRFDAATGKCASIPYSKIVPAQAKLTLYPTREIGNQVLVWYHPDEAEPDFEPFDPSVFDADAAWVVAANKRLEGTSPFRDLLENLFDTAHIQQLHGSAELPVPESVTRTAYGMRCAFGENKDAFTIKGMEFNFTGISMVTHFVDGEGFAFMQVASGTPIDHERFLLNVNMYVRDTGNAEMNQFMGQAFANRVVSEIDQDFAVTNFKKHLKQPLLCAGDGPIITWRKYAEEFFV